MATRVLGLLCLVRTGVNDAVMLGVVRDEGRNRPLVRLDRRRTRLELLGHVVVRMMWLWKVVESHAAGF